MHLFNACNLQIIDEGIQKSALFSLTFTKYGSVQQSIFLGIFNGSLSLTE